MRTGVLPLMAVASVVVSCALSSCGDSSNDTQPEVLESFDLDLPGTVTVGESFSLSVTAVGSGGTRPHQPFSGTVLLTAPDGFITPDSLDLADGEGGGQVVLSTSRAAQTITATYEDVTGSTSVNCQFMTGLRGDSEGSANEAIPGFAFLAKADDYSIGHPSLGSMHVSHNVVMVAFEPGATVREVNAVLSGVGARIVGGVPGVDGVGQGTLFLELPTVTHAELSAAVASLEQEDAVMVAVQDVLMGPDAIPRPNDGEPPGWTWEAVPAGPNWGLERIRVPQMWNLNDAVAKKLATQSFSSAAVLIVDTGFSRNHPDVYTLNSRPEVLDSHGAHVSGIIGARCDNEAGIDGVCPDVFMSGCSMTVDGGTGVFADRISAGQAAISAVYHGVRAYTDLVNMSFGYNWAAAGVDSDNEELAQSIAAKQAGLMVDMLHLSALTYRSPLIVCSAGNDSQQGFGDQDAMYNSPMCYAALSMGTGNILVVEAVTNNPGTTGGQVTRVPSSSVNGHLSAPGEDIWGTANGPPLYRSGDGTSYAAAMVSGVAAFLNNVEPYITYDEVRELILANTEFAGGGAQPRIDAWASVVDIDRVRGGTAVLDMMCDIDDGTPDGNLRVTYSDGVDYLEEDADADDGIGDGVIDMSDFRRWRDWYLLTQGAVECDLDGPADHPKKDVNRNGVVEAATGENIYPRGDLNGDGRLDLGALSYVPGAVGATVTDLEVLMQAFDDPDRTAMELPGLVRSSDITVDLASFLALSGLSSVDVRMWLGDGTPYRTVTVSDTDPLRVFTDPYHADGYFVHLDLQGTPGVAGDYFEFGHDSGLFVMAAGEDAWLEPLVSMSLDPKASYLHVCQDPGALDAVPFDLAALGIRPGDWLLIDQVGYFDGGGGWTHMDKMCGVFSSSDVLLGGDQLHRVQGAIDAGEDELTGDTHNCDTATDIPEDFAIDPYVRVRVPANARFLFIAPDETKYEDNRNDGGYSVQICRIRMKGCR